MLAIGEVLFLMVLWTGVLIVLGLRWHTTRLNRIYDEHMRMVDQAMTKVMAKKIYLRSIIDDEDHIINKHMS